MENKFHKNFQFQGTTFANEKELLSFSLTISLDVHIFLKEWFNNKPFVQVHTSGSTGTPKNIQLLKSHMVNSALATGHFFNLYENSKVLLCMPVNFIAGKMMIVRALILGWHLDFVEPSSTPLISIHQQYDFSAMVPLQVHNSLHQLHTIKKLLIGGGAVSKDLSDKLQNIDNEVFVSYGMTETITHIAIKKLNNFKNNLSTNEQSYFKVLPSISIATDKRGCLIVDAPNIASEKVVTNDLVELVSETEFKWLGRYDSVINSGGIKLIPEQIEEKLAVIISNRFFVAGLNDAVLGEKLVLIIEGTSTTEIFDKIKNLSTLLKYEQPKEIFFLKEFITTPTQKINRPETIKLLKNIY